jgi:hypothetical protein
LANCFGVANNEKGTNTNRCVVLVKGQAKCMNIAFLMGEVKREFNTSNKELYAGKFSKELFSVTA